MDELIFALLGLLSGTLSSWTFDPYNLGGYSSLWPGLLFGIAMAFFFISRKKLYSWMKIIGFVLLSVVAYIIAHLITLQITPNFITYYWNWPAYFCGGFIGALLLSMSFSGLLHHLTWKKILALAFVGGILGGVGYQISYLFCMSCYVASMSGPFGGFNWLFVIWQTGMALGFGMML
jgi:hypothetical protein